jgi:hypothetical protein
MSKDLFENPHLLPLEVITIIGKYEEMDHCYEMCHNLTIELEQVGYTCDYGLDGTPYDLQKINN